MPASENTRKIIVDQTGRITALPDNLRPLKVGDRILIDRKRVDSADVVEKIREVSTQHSRQLSHLMAHAIETFGSEEAAEEWMSIECGALNNESPANFIRKTGNLGEVDRILGCIDYGMIA
jgi:uncharacterized protein (DUF2384 family)